MEFFFCLCMRKVFGLPVLLFASYKFWSFLVNWLLWTVGSYALLSRKERKYVYFLLGNR